MNEERFVEITAQMMSDQTPLPVVIQIKEAWMLICGLQLATRHPDLSKVMCTALENIARQFQAAIVELHPRAKPLLDTGWDQRFDVGKDDSSDMNLPSQPDQWKSVNNCWTIYAADTKEGDPAYCQIGRPQDWGDPRWMYRVYTLEAQGYRNTVHCWVDMQMKEHEHLQLFASVVVQIMLPGWPIEKSGRDFMDEDDFWSEAWGEMPPFADMDEDDY